MITVSIAVAQGALNRKECRGGHTREDYPGPDPELGKVNFVQHQTGEHGFLAPIDIAPEPLPEMPAELRGPVRGSDTEPMADEVTMRVWRGDESGGEFEDYVMPADEGEVVLDVIHRIQADPGARPGLPLELQGRQVRVVLRRDQRAAPPHVHDPHGHAARGRAGHRGPDEDLPDHPRPGHRRVVQLRGGQDDPGVHARPPSAEGGYRMMQVDVERGQEFRKCIECFLCQDVCHVIRDHEDNKPKFAGPRFFIRFAELEMHPLDVQRPPGVGRDERGLGMCNITKCCTEVCPEHIKITDNGIIPMKERVVDARYDPVAWLGRKITGRSKKTAEEASAG